MSRKARIETGKRDFDSKIKYRLLRSITRLIDSKTKIPSFTDFMLGAISEFPGEIVDTEVFLRRENLCGSIDVLRRTKAGYIIQEEKVSDPPEGDGVWPGDLLQVDAYAFLVESNFQAPIVGGIIIYDDLIPRQVKPNPRRVKEVLENVMALLKSRVLPEAEGNNNKCLSCSYYPLCQILPKQGGITETQIRNGFRSEDRDKTAFLVDYERLQE